MKKNWIFTIILFLFWFNWLFNDQSDVYPFLNVLALRSLINIVISTLPNSIYMNKNVSIGINISNSFMKL